MSSLGRIQELSREVRWFKITEECAKEIGLERGIGKALMLFD
jgi:hypothetical protein